MKLRVLTILLFSGISFLASAQSVIPIDSTIEHFVKTMLIGARQDAFNIQGKYNASIGAFYDFDDTELGLDYGVILSTGHVISALGPNDYEGTGSNLGFGGDSSLAPLVAAPLFDATTIEFDFVPVTNEISFKYVFASEEYPEYVNSNFNDIFGFFVSGPGIEDAPNIALLPDGSAVTINNVNHQTNTQWFKNNSINGGLPLVDTAHIEYDGFTIPLDASIEVIPFQTYHIKMVIADAYDAVWDSAIFLKAKSFESVPLVINFDFAESEYFQTIFEDDKPLIISAELPNPAKQDITYHFSYSGDAELGQDFLAPKSFTFKQGDTLASFQIEPINDNVLEGVEDMMLVIDETKDTLHLSIAEHAIVPTTDAEEGRIALYPNPAHGSFSIPSNVEVKAVTLYTLTGKKVKEFRQEFQQMDIQALPKGMYAVHVVTPNGLLVSSLEIE